MKDQIWPAIYEVFSGIQDLIGQTQEVFAVKDKTQFRGMQVFKRGIQNEDVTPLRAEVRNRLNFLKAKLSETLTERETYLILFPIVIYFDEIVQSKIFKVQQLTWPPLQKELFEIENGGEMFYDTIDDILRKPETIPLVYQVFYFCLSDGLLGKYGENPVKIEEYKSKLRAKIPIPFIPSQEKQGEVPDLMHSEKFPFWSYFFIVVFLMSVYAGLYAFMVL